MLAIIVNKAQVLSSVVPDGVVGSSVGVGVGVGVVTSSLTADAR
ncbi:MAG: hypothetical protein ACTSQF_08100 [Candidatus Heimdallarchaeaceae archaeon]